MNNELHLSRDNRTFYHAKTVLHPLGYAAFVVGLTGRWPKTTVFRQLNWSRWLRAI